VSANAATIFEIEEFNRATELSNFAVSSKDYVNGFENIEDASKLGNKVSQFTLALLYMEGVHVEQDYTQAYLWLNVAAEAKEKQWREVRNQLHNALTDEQVAALTPLVNEYIEKYGKETQEVSCYRRARTGSSIKVMQCTKVLTRR
jgi:TPR repeat protein